MLPVERKDIAQMGRKEPGSVRVLARPVAVPGPVAEPSPFLELAAPAAPDPLLAKVVGEMKTALEKLAVTPAGQLPEMTALCAQMAALVEQLKRKRNYDLVPVYGHRGGIEKIEIREL